MFAVIFNDSSSFIPAFRIGADKWNGACMDSHLPATFSDEELYLFLDNLEQKKEDAHVDAKF